MMNYKAEGFVGSLYLAGICIILLSWFPVIPMAFAVVGWVFLFVGFLTELYHKYYMDGDES